MNYRQIKAIEEKNKRKWLSYLPTIPEKSGIYVLTRVDEYGIKYSYVGQAKHILTRLAQHLSGYQHIDLSLKKHGIYSESNRHGWSADFIEFSEEELNDREQEYIRYYIDMGYQSHNKTLGSQGVGKVGLGDGKTPKGYYDGIAQGKKNLAKEIRTLLEKHLKVTTKDDPPNRYQQKALEKFNDLIKE